MLLLLRALVEEFKLGDLYRLYLALVSREWKNGSTGSYNCTPFPHSLVTKGKFKVGMWR